MPQPAVASKTVQARLSASDPTTLFGYEVVGRLGHGAGSLVYAVSKPGTGQLFALKQVLRQAADDDRFVDQLTNEYLVSRQFKYPGLRRCSLLRLKRGWGFKVVEAALMMDYIDGESLDSSPLPLPDLLECLIHAAQALQTLHALGYVHCDIKPGNILRTITGHSTLIDFGQTCHIGTIKDRIQGTPDYIALEQVRRQAVSPQTDIFSLGATMYWLLTKQYVPTAVTLGNHDPMVLARQEFPSPRDLRPDLPPAWSDLIMRCVRWLPNERPRHMREVLECLEQLRPACR